MKALIDADIVLYRAGFASEYNVYSLYPVVDEEPTKEALLVSRYKKEINETILDKGLESCMISTTRELQPLSFALQSTKTLIDSILERSGATSYTSFITHPDSTNYRKAIATYKEYKGNRRGAPKPHWKDDIMKYIMSRYNGVLVDGQEADDAMGIEQCNSDNTIICSIDKDLLQIPGDHFVFTKEDNEAYINVPQDEADEFFFRQALTGDITDNIAGCPRVAMKTAVKTIDSDNPWESIVECYRSKLSATATRPDDMKFNEDRVSYTHWNGEDVISKTIEEFAIENAQLVRIRRAEGELWNPQ